MTDRHMRKRPAARSFLNPLGGRTTTIVGLGVLSRRQLLQGTAGALGATALLPAIAFAADESAPTWAAVERAARGQTVYFNAWAGSDKINAYIAWAGGQLAQRHGVTLEHVKITDAAEVVKRVRAEKQAGRAQDGSVDLLWINGENFLTMKREGLLHGPFAERLPNFAAVDVQGKPTTRLDFGEPVEGMEAPWGMAQLTFFADRKRVPAAPASAAELLAWVKAHPGRFTYPRPPQFHGTTFLKQILTELNPDRESLTKPVERAAFEKASAPLWAWLDAARPHLWRQGTQYPASDAAISQMVADGELWIGLSFNPNEAANLVAAKTLPATVYSYQHAKGTLGNTHFVAIPFNARAKAGAQVVANFLLSPEAQARKADITVWGDPTVLAVKQLGAAQREGFMAKVPGAVEQAAPALPEPHGSWVDALERAWAQRYGA